jgi:hypothetical protein
VPTPAVQTQVQLFQVRKEPPSYIVRPLAEGDRLKPMLLIIDMLIDFLDPWAGGRPRGAG